MKNHVRTLHSLILAAFILAGANLRAASPYFFAQQPETITAEVGTFAAFSVHVSQPASATYQWQFGQLLMGTNVVWVDITDKTNRDLAIPAPSTDNVGAYRVRASWGPTNVLSSNVFLSVYELHGTNSTSGTLTTSALQFVAPPTPGTFTCPYYPSIIFDKSHNPANSAGDFYFFYGRRVPVSAQPGPFVNSGYNKYLEVKTAKPAPNFPTFTGVKLLNGFDPPPLPPSPPNPCVVCGCESGNSDLTPDMDFYEIPDNTSPLLARYRVTIYHKTPAPTSGNIVMNWLYFD